MLMVYTQEISAEFAGFPLSVTVPPDCSCGENGGCSGCGTKTITIHAHQRDDGASEQWLNLTASTDELRRVLREALGMIGEA